ncbi:MAG TPA: DUF4157 domain-containing protein [Kofleriaceae bacterium]|jgi:hypothetical protein
MLLFRGEGAEGFDPIAEGARHGLDADAARALWMRITATRDPDAARAAFAAEATSARKLRRRPDVGKRTRVAQRPAPLAFDDYRVIGLRDVARAAGELGDEVIASAEAPIARRAARWRTPAGEATARGQALAGAAERHAATLYRRATREGADVDDPSVARALAARGDGAALPAELQRIAEAELGVSLAGVRIHTDELAARAAEAAGAEAFTVGEDVFFAAGAFTPDTDAGRTLVAHELAHVAQALRGRHAAVDATQASRPGDALEVEADAVAARIAQRPMLDRMAALFGADFRGVTLHEHSRATGGAKAVARGADVHLAGAVGDPHVLAHELAHVVQATAHGPAAPAGALEAEADRAADLVSTGRPARVGLAARAGAEYAYTDAKGNVVPDPFDVTWNGDTFHLEFRKEELGSHYFHCKMTYTGQFQVSGPGITASTKVADFSVMVTTSALQSSILSKTATTLVIDLLGDGHSQIVRIADSVQIKAGQGRQHTIDMTLNRASSGGGNFTVLDAGAKASDVQAPEPDERPGMTPVPMGSNGFKVWDVELDGDGDQFRELALKLEDLSKSGATRVRMTLTQLATKTQVVRELHLPPAETGDAITKDTLGLLMPQITQLCDGGRSTILTLRGDQKADKPTLVIDMPTRTDKSTTYHVKGPGFDESLAFPVSKAHSVFTPGAASVDGGIVNVDLTLGPYRDKFRFTIQPRTATTAVFGISQLGYHDQAAGAQSANLTISKPINFQQLTTGDTSFGFDIDGDKKTDLMIYDLMTSPVAGTAGTPESDRDHTIRVVGAAIGGEQTFAFRVRDGGPMWDGSTQGTDHVAGSNSVAIDGLKDQKAEGTDLADRLNTYEMAMIAERRKAVPAIIAQTTLDAWAALSESMIKLRGQKAQDKTLLAIAAGQAVAFYTLLSTETASAQTTTAARGTAVTENPYTGLKHVSGNASTGAGPELPADLQQGNLQKAIADYQALVGGLDKWILDRTVAKGLPADKLKLIEGKRTQLGELDGLGAQPVMAVFQPDVKFKNENGYVSQVPLSLYYWKEGSTWHLRNVSNPEHVYSVTKHAGADDAASLQELMGELSDPDRMPAGLIHYEIPGKTSGEVKTKDGMTWKKALTYLGLALAAVGFTLATFGAGAVEVAGVVATAGAGLASAGAAAIDLYDKHAHGDLDAKTAVLDLAQIVSGLAGAAAVTSGRITVAAANAPAGARWAGNWAQIAKLSSQIYLPATRAAAAADALTLAVITPQMALELDKVDANGKLRLLIQWAGMATLTGLQIKGAVPKAGSTRTIVLTPGPDGRPVATLALGADSTIIDSNLTIALDKQAKGQPLSELDKKLIQRAGKLTDMRITDPGLGEVGGDLGARGTPISAERTSPEYQDLLKNLEGKPPVGRTKGVKDRSIVADAFFGITEPGAKPTLATGDSGIYNPLAERAGIKTARLGGKTLPEALASPGGVEVVMPDKTKVILKGDRFDVTINGKTLTVIPIR